MLTKILTAVLLAATISSCAIIPAPADVRVVTREIPQRIYQPPAANPIELEDVTWFVITPENLEEQIARIEEMQADGFVIFGLLPQDYENMSYNFQEMRRYIRQQGEIILYYRETTDVGNRIDWEESSPEQPAEEPAQVQSTWWQRIFNR